MLSPSPVNALPNASALTVSNTVAYGEYGTGKDVGEHKGHVEEGVFQMALNGFTKSGESKVLTASFDPKSPIYFQKVFNDE